MDAFSASLMADKREIIFAPTVYKFQTFAQMAEEFKLNERDVVLTNEFIYTPFMKDLGLKCHYVFQEKFGAGEPSEEMIQVMYDAIPYDSYDRVIAVGGGAIMDLCKLLGCKRPDTVHNLYFKRFPVVHEKDVIAIPTTCGTGSECTNISVAIVKDEKDGVLTGGETKLGLVSDDIIPNKVCLIPELLKTLPYKPFACSAIDALVHAVESALSPKATPYTKLFGYKAIEMIIRGYQTIAKKGPESRFSLLNDFLLASNYAGLAFGTAGCAAVHATSYPLGGKYHVAHGESNYAMFTGVLKNYMELRRDGEIAVLNQYLADLLGCMPDVVYDELEKLLDQILPKRPLREYGVTREDLPVFAHSVVTEQGRLMANNFVPLDEARVLKIYQELF